MLKLIQLIGNRWTRVDLTKHNMCFCARQPRLNMVSAIPIEPSQGVRSVEPSVLRPYWLAVTLVGESKIILLAAYPTIIY